MSATRNTTATIFVATDIVSDAEMVKKLLAAEYGKVIIPAGPEQSITDFEQNRPDVLVLAFKSLEKSQRFCLSLYRRGDMHLQTCAVIVLCSVGDVDRAYKLCREDLFDDYVLFWPMTTDGPRLLMSVYLALKNLGALAENASIPPEFAKQIRELSSLGNLLNQKLAQGDDHIESIGRAVTQASSNSVAAFDHLLQKLARGELLGMADKTAMDALKNELSQLKNKSVDSGYGAIAESVKPLKKSVSKFREATVPHVASVNTLNKLVDKLLPTILVVDDDEFQLKIIGRILGQLQYQIQFASSGNEALDIVGRMTPALILMDVMMSGMSGIETVMQIRSARRLAGVPILMITGNSEKKVVTESLKAGANGFVVKPVTSDTLLAKVVQALEGGATLTCDSSDPN